MTAQEVRVARAAVVKIAQILSRESISVTQQGSQAYCEADKNGRPQRINLPSIPNDASEQILRATQGFLDHEVGHALFSDFAAAREAAEDSLLLKLLHNLVEDVFVERRMAERFRGAERNLDDTRRFVLDEHIDPAFADLRAEDAEEDALFALLSMPMIRAWAGQPAMAAYMADKWGRVAGHAALFADLTDQFAAVADSWSALALARELESRLARDAPQTRDLMARQALEVEILAELDQQEDDKPLAGASYDRALARALSRRLEQETRSGEWRPFTLDADRIEPMPIGEADWSRALARMRAETDPVVGPLARSLERLLAARKLQHWVGGRRRGRLNAAALHRAPLGDPRVFRQRVAGPARDAAISLVVDLSGSMAGRKAWIACAAALAMSETLTRAGVAHEAIGFTTLDPEAVFRGGALREYRAESARARRRGARSRRSDAEGSPRRYSRLEPLHMPVLKGFDERLGPAVRPRFAAAACDTEHMRNNVDHECLQIAARRLMARPEQRRAMIVFSDGEPAFDGDVGASCELLGAEVARLERLGVHVYGVGVESRAVERFYPRRVVIDSVAALPAAMAGLVARALL